MSIAPFGRSRIALLVAAVVLVVVVAAGIGGRLVPTTATATATPPGATPGTTLEPTPGTSPTARPTPRPTSAPSPTLRPLVECRPPSILPAAPKSADGPRVRSESVSLLFTSYLYRRDGASLVARDVSQGDWAMGLWRAPAGRETAELLLAPEGGMVLPLAVSPAQDTAIVWWLPQRREPDEPSCESGIYVFSLTDGSSRLLETGDWSAPITNPEELPDDTGLNPIAWRDDTGRCCGYRDYRLPRFSFSADGQFLSEVDGPVINLLRVDDGSAVRRHVGSCQGWAWSPSGAMFVAGCEDLSAAWFVDAGEGFADETLALPIPPAALRKFTAGWEEAHQVAVTGDGRILVVRSYGYATGCETEDCTLPPLGVSFTSIDPRTQESTTRIAEVDFLVNGFSTDMSFVFSADRTWVYAPGESDRTNVIRADGIETARTPYQSVLVGASRDGTLLYWLEQDDAGDAIATTVVSMDATGHQETAAALFWAAGTAETETVLPTVGLIAVR